MKTFKLAAVLLLAGLGAATQPAHAITYSQGDVLIGFRSTDGSITTDYLIDVGQALFAQAASHGGTVTIGNFSTDLNALDPNWFTDGTTLWGVAGANLTGDNTKTLYAGYAESSVNPTPGSTYNGRTNTSQQNTIGFYNTVGNNFANGSIVAGSSTGDDGSFNYPGLQVQSQTASSANSWAKQVSFSSGLGFQQFAGFEGSVGSGSTGDHIDYYKINPSPSTPLLEGTFNVSSNGTITFTTGVIPEPSALAAFVGGAALLGLIRRRRPVVA